jgi:hypothetical protein
MATRNDDTRIERLATDLENAPSDEGGNAPAGAPRELPAGLAATVGDRCADCGAPLAVDQRYCVECGERRGQPRFPVVASTADGARAPARPRRPWRWPHVSAGGTLVAGIATLLLAMGVGVLIGHSGNSSSNQRASTPPVQVVTVSGGGGGALAAAGAPTSKTAAAKKSTAKANAAKAKAHAKTAVNPHKAAAAASKVLGTSGKTLPPPTVTVGQQGHGAGYQGGKFTGTFFGGG